MNIERARRLVLGHIASTDSKQREQIAQRMVETGECVWHAASVVTNSKCFCADCFPEWGKEK